MIANFPYIISQLVQPFNLLLMIVGTAIGIIFGAIPGLSGTLAVMLFMPLTYSMNSGTAVIFLLALWIGGCSGVYRFCFTGYSGFCICSIHLLGWLPDEPAG